MNTKILSVILAAFLALLAAPVYATTTTTTADINAVPTTTTPYAGKAGPQLAYYVYYRYRPYYRYYRYHPYYRVYYPRYYGCRTFIKYSPYLGRYVKFRRCY